MITRMNIPVVIAILLEKRFKPRLRRGFKATMSGWAFKIQGADCGSPSRHVH